jgi:ABC-type multidrug transport system fused ATPase/permease subunit
MRNLLKSQLVKIEWLKLAKTSLNLLDSRSKVRIILATLALSCLAILDVIAIGLVGLLSLMTLEGISTGDSSTKVASVLRLLNIQSLTFQAQASVLAGLIAVCFIGRILVSISVTKKMLRFLSNRSVEISKSLVDIVLQRDVGEVKAISRSSISYGLTEGVDRIVVGVIGSVMNIGADFTLIVILIISLNFIDFTLGITSVFFFGFIGVAIYLRQGNVSAKLGKMLSKRRIQIADRIFGVIDSLREVHLRGALRGSVSRITELRSSQSQAWAQMSFQPFMAKYYLEIGMVIGAIVIGGVQFMTHDAKHAVGYLSLFLAAGVRIIPSILRLQSSLINIRSSSGVASVTLDLLNLPTHVPVGTSGQMNSDSFPGIRFSNVSFSYKSNANFALTGLDIEIEQSKFTAIVGPSGSGKSTIFDLALGFARPTVGEVAIEGLHPTGFIENHPGLIALVPQQVHISKDSLRQNLLLGYDGKVNDKDLYQLLESLELSDLVSSLPEGLDSGLGEFGSRLSGGQKQRIGIARAVCTRPRYLFLDEATSSLDAATENVIMNFLAKMKSKMTIVVIAHRLTTVQAADQVIYVEKGQVLSTGTFSEVRAKVPNFELQAGLMGIK